MDNKFPVTYAQYNEDLILLALLSDIKKGFYVDVGANYPVIDSVTKLFYENGWRGINIEPIVELHKQLQVDRPEDINLPLGVSDKSGMLEFYENSSIPGHSSFSLKDAEQSGEGSISKYNVKVDTLKNIFSKYNVSKIHFLKIDVEGLEESVIKGNDWKIYRPIAICIEVNHRSTSWQKILLKNDYKLFISDGLNEYYLAKEEWARTDGFADKIVSLCDGALRLHQYRTSRHNIKQLKKLTKLNQDHYDMVQSLLVENSRLRHENKFSLMNRSYRERISRSIRGLTTDWLRYRKSKKSR